MSDNDKNKEAEIAASAEDEPEVIGDEKLDDAEGGWSWGTSLKTTNVVMSGGSTMLKLDGLEGESDKVIDSMDAEMLRKRPGRFGSWSKG
ncbi:MAG: hypothetical protein AAGD13_19530 [Pseudomonadota bacterium]